MRFVRACISSSLLVLAAPAIAQPVDVAALFHDIATDGDLLREQAKNWFGAIGPHGVALDAFMSSVFGDPAFAAYVDRMSSPVGRDTQQWLREEVTHIGKRAAAVTGWGIGSLSTAAQLTYVDFYHGLAVWTETAMPERCSVFGGTSPAEPELIAIEGYNRATLSPDEVDAYLGVLYDALQATITDAPRVNAFAEADLDRGQTAFVAALRANPATAPIFANDNAALPATAFCRASAAAFQTFLDLPEPDRTFALQLTMQGDMRF